MGEGCATNIAGGFDSRRRHQHETNEKEMINTGYLNGLAREIHENAVAHGWWEDERGFPEACMMIVTEIAEAVDEYRNDTPELYGTRDDGLVFNYENYRKVETVGEFFAHGGLKPEGAAVELVDGIIRSLDLLAHMGADVDGLMEAKIGYNRTRPYRHGDKKC